MADEFDDYGTVVCDDPHPMQQIRMVNKVARFRENKIVSAVLATSKLDLNALAILEFSQADRIQFAQLIGYSVSGFGDLSYSCPEIVAKADSIVEEGLPHAE